MRAPHPPTLAPLSAHLSAHRVLLRLSVEATILQEKVEEVRFEALRRATKPSASVVKHELDPAAISKGS